MTHNVTVNFSTPSDGVSSTLFNITLHYFKPVYGVKLEFKIYVSDNAEDTTFLREFFRTSLDIQKLIDGINGNSLLKGLGERLMNSMDFKIRFPMPAGIYKFTNLTFTGYMFPMLSRHFRINANFYTKWSMKKRMNWSSSVVVLGKLN